ncbi:Phenylacetaldoxime dehydratase [Variovorax sp. SRS16]|uniref:phenylacetaldoxime dehydratase family protein n=1 Tax=Variovorax sp. SRS16 TaxID=282217 RepID=UPI0013199F4D|nr:phenylacetaldoxime dehydratase family protein [Variovorax sp. SRS16]VTU31141.1 Phenylacetaldoxime dehydratase [Variovorax sp. SRS16]
MSEISSGADEMLPEDYPGRIVAFPEGIEHLVFAMFGMQGKSEEAANPHRKALCQLFELPDGPGNVERSHYVDPQGYHCDVFMTYWAGRDAFERWVHSETVTDWWASLSTDPSNDVGVWREVLSPHKDRFNYAAGVEEKAGSAAILPLEPCNKFGYWGSYRDRLPGSKVDDFQSPYETMPEPVLRETKGKRILISTPDNMCFIREGQGWDRCEPEERRVWKTMMEKVVEHWVAFLRDRPSETGCMSIRFCREQDLVTGVEREKQSQFGFLLSLGHIEQAARTQKCHLAVRSKFIDMYTEPKFQPQMHIWVEEHVLKSDEVDAQYVNCHPKTGLLPYFDATEIPADRGVRLGQKVEQLAR